MTLEELAYISQIIGVIAVLASLIFVAVQLRQNTRAVLVSTAQTHFTMWHSVSAPLLDDADMARTFLNALSDFDGLTELERMRFLVLVGNLFRFYEASRIQWRRGQLDSELWRAVEVNIREFATQPSIQKFWKIRKHWHSVEFINWFESLPSEVPSSIYGQNVPAVQKVAATSPNL